LTRFHSSKRAGVIRLRDVAIRAQVSAATTSRVLSGKEFVSEALRQRVLQAAEDLNYSPNGLARSMAGHRTLTLGLVVSDVTNHFFTAVARGVEDAGQKAGYSVVLCNTDEQLEKERSYLSVLREKRVDGIIMAISSSEVGHIRRIVEGGTLMVLIDRAAWGLELPSVLVDNEGGVRRATEYLLDLGHRSVGVVCGSSEVATSRERVKGYRAALSAAGIPFDPSLVVEGAFKETGGHSAAMQLWRRPDRPTAIMSLSNVMTTGALLALRQCGARIPEDISFIGFDDLPYFELLEYPLTVVTQPTYELGRYACELLLQSIEHGGLPALPAQEIRLPTQLIIRSSCSRVNANQEEAPIA
jgi:LacI family transcriptional regulator